MMLALSAVETIELRCAVKLIEYGLRITSVYQILDGKVARDQLVSYAKIINPDVCKQGKTPSRAPLATAQERMLTTHIYKLYHELRMKLPSVSLAEAVVHLYEKSWAMSKHPVFKRAFSADEVYATVRNINNGHLKLTACPGSRGSHHAGTAFDFVVGQEEPAKGLCPWCMLHSRRSRKSQTAQSRAPEARAEAVNS